MDETKLVSEKSTWKEVICAFREISEELELFGVPTFPEVEISQESELTVDEFIVLLKSLINASCYMLHRHRKVLREYEELELMRMRDIDDNHALKATVERLKKELAEKDRALLKSEDEVRILKSKLGSKEQELKTQSEEVRTVKCQLKYNEKKNAHDFKKKDLQISKLQMQLEKIIGSRPVSKVKSTVVSKETKVSKCFTDNEEAYQKILCKFEASNKGLMLENEVIHKSLHKLNGDLSSLVKLCGEALQLHGISNMEEKKKNEQKTTEQAMNSHSVLSLEECLASSNKYVETLNELLDSLKEKYL